MRAHALFQTLVLLALPCLAVSQTKTAAPVPQKPAHDTVPVNIMVLGAVLRPGAYPLTPQMRLADALKLAQPADRANLSQVYILKPTGKRGKFEISRWDASMLLSSTAQEDAHNPLLRSDESVFVPSKKSLPTKSSPPKFQGHKHTNG